MTIMPQDPDSNNDPPDNRQLGPLCGMSKPGGSTTCTEPAGHAGPDGKGASHGDGSVTRWIYR